MNTSERSSPSIIPNHTIGHPTLSPPNTLSAPPPPPSSQPPLRDHTPPAPPPAPAPGGLVYGEGGGPTAWWTPIQAKTDVSIGTKKARMHRSAPGSNRVNGVEDPGPEPAVSVEDRDGATTSIEIVPMSNRPRLRKVDDSGKLVWPFELEAVLIAGQCPPLLLLVVSSAHSRQRSPQVPCHRVSPSSICITQCQS
ncbi:hypothetical protein FRC16_003364 [Serendipita sp. 398]|nr:hypothetical protein FRC16_003364 [Serendipita sp. 398]